MDAIVHPVTRRSDAFAGRDDRGMPNDRDQIAVATRLDPDDAKAVLGVLISDALDQPGEDLPN
jgi:hypothetical protein